MQEVRVAAGAAHARPPGRLPDLPAAVDEGAGAGSRPAACSRWRCGWWSSASARSRPSCRRSTGRSRRRSRGAAPPPFTAKFAKLDGKQGRADQRGQAREVVDVDQERAAAWSRRSSARSGARTRRRPSSPRKLQQEASRKLRFSPKRTMGAGPAALRRRRARRRGPGRSHHLHAYRLDAPLATTPSPRRAPTSASATAPTFAARRADRLQDQEERAGRPRGDPADRRSSTTPRRCASCLGRRRRAAGETSGRRDGPAAALHADLEPLRRLPDGAGGLRPDQRSTSTAGRVDAARQRSGDEVRRLPRGLRRDRRGRRGQRGRDGDGALPEVQRGRALRAARDRSPSSTSPSRRRASPRRRWSRSWRRRASAARRPTRRSSRPSRTAATWRRRRGASTRPSSA